MENVIKDAIYCLNIINNHINSGRGFGKLYRNTNENLTKVLTSYDFKDKNVLSVLASSDQIFSCYFLGANNVDTFDSNKLTYYYFFLKKWAILKTGKPYIPAKNSELIDIIKLHDNSEEEINAAYFWKYILVNINCPLYYSNLFHVEPIVYDLPYQNNINDLYKIIVNKNPNYQYLNFFNPLNINKKYDIVVLSNMLEYLYEDKLDYKYQIIAAKNINNLLNDEGIAISSNIIDYEYQGNPIFENYFEYIDGPTDKSYLMNKEIPICYVYKKRKTDFQ